VRGGPSDARVAEQLLVLRAQTGSPEAYHGLFERYNGRLVYYVRRMLTDAVDAEDVVQEVWVSVIRNLAKLEEPAAFRTWLYRIARNRAISRLRRARHEVLLDEDDDAAEHGAEDVERWTGAEAEDSSEWSRTDVEALHAALGDLSPSHRDVLTLRFIEGLSYEEIATVVECGVGTVRSRIHYAKRSLRDIMNERQTPE